MSLLNHDYVEVAYKKLRQMIYFEKTHLFQRKRLAEFECDSEFHERLGVVERVFNADSPTDSPEFQQWLSGIKFAVLPKGVVPDNKPSDADGTFVTNVTSSKSYNVKKVNYIFDGPIELHLIGVLWLMIDGQKLDRQLSNHCKGSRLYKLVGTDKDHSAHLFRKYHELYAEFRDDGIKKAKDMLVNDGQGVCIAGLDLQEYYYRIRLDWKKLHQSIQRPRRRRGVGDIGNETEYLGERLLRCIWAICERYQAVVAPHLEVTHELPPGSTCLPIGFCPSPVIANWYLKEFDSEVLNKVRPAYYGRYVDDIMLVIPFDVPTAAQADPVKEFMHQVLVQAGLITPVDADTPGREASYELVCKPGLFLQKKKCTLQYFDAEHSTAGLEKFARQLEQNASDFALLPVEGEPSPVEQVAYDLLYDGSVNKLRSVKEIAENRLELAKHLARQTQLHLIADAELDPGTERELFRFFKGRNAIEYWDMWERVFGFLVVADRTQSVKNFEEAIKSEILKVRFEASKEMQGCLRETLWQHLELSRELSMAVREWGPYLRGYGAGLWRQSNLIRHHLVKVPLLNYTDYEGDLCMPEKANQATISKERAVRSPRFVHFDECATFVDSGLCTLSEDHTLITAQNLYEWFHGSKQPDVTITTPDPQKRTRS